MSIKVNFDLLKSFVTDKDFESVIPALNTAHGFLYENNVNAPGNHAHGWLDLPINYDKEEFARIKAAAKKIQNDSKILVVIGIGGSSLGARAAIEFVKGKNYNFTCGKLPKIFFVGNSMSPAELNEVVGFCKDVDFSVNVISKSGTTIEPAIAFHIFKKLLTEKYGDKANERIYATTDAVKGTLHGMALKEDYERFVIPDDVGGRYSVLTAVGLLPIAVAGIDIDVLMSGAADSREKYSVCSLDNDCYKYAVARQLLYRSGKAIELFISYEPDFLLMNEWLKQLFGESEGKEGKGLYPSSAIYSTDLHSMGQYVQDGARILFETVVHFENSKSEIEIELDEDDSDGLNFLAGENLSSINKRACIATALAHTDGKVPNIIINVDGMDAYNLGALIYFFEKACAISGYILGVNPFDQPGVEVYKKNMFALLGKPGYEELRAELKARI
jgi:glucose-6-phosphate isomerase